MRLNDQISAALNFSKDYYFQIKQHIIKVQLLIIWLNYTLEHIIHIIHTSTLLTVFTVRVSEHNFNVINNNNNDYISCTLQCFDTVG